MINICQSTLPIKGIGCSSNYIGGISKIIVIEKGSIASYVGALNSKGYPVFFISKYMRKKYGIKEAAKRVLKRSGIILNFNNLK